MKIIRATKWWKCTLSVFLLTLSIWRRPMMIDNAIRRYDGRTDSSLEYKYVGNGDDTWYWKEERRMSGRATFVIREYIGDLIVLSETIYWRLSEEYDGRKYDDYDVFLLQISSWLIIQPEEAYSILYGIDSIQSEYIRGRKIRWNYDMSRPTYHLMLARRIPGRDVSLNEGGRKNLIMVLKEEYDDEGDICYYYSLWLSMPSKSSVKKKKWRAYSIKLYEEIYVSEMNMIYEGRIIFYWRMTWKNLKAMSKSDYMSYETMKKEYQWEKIYERNSREIYREIEEDMS